MKISELVGPVGLVIRGGNVYQYYKNGQDVLVEEKLKKRTRVFIRPEKKEKVLKEIRKLGVNQFNIVDDVTYIGDKVYKASLISLPSENEEIKLKLKVIDGVIGVEENISNSRKQEYWLSKLEESNFSTEFGYFLDTRVLVGEEGKLIIQQEKPKTRKEATNQIEKLRKKLVLFTVDYETYGDQIVLATLMRSDGLSKVLIVNENSGLLEEFKKILGGYEIELVPDEKSLIKKIYEYRRGADIEMVHGSSLLEKQKDYEEFPSTKERPEDKFDIPIYFKPVQAIQVVTSEGITPSTDSLYISKHERPTIRSLEDFLGHFLNDKETLKKTDYRKFKIYLKIKNAEDLYKLKKEVEETVTHNFQDAVAHLKLAEFLLFDQELLVLPMFFSIDIETVFKKTMEEIGEAILTSEFVQGKIFPKMRNESTKLARKKERIVDKYDRILTEKYGQRIKGRWIYPSFAFVPQIVEDEEEFRPYLNLFEKIFRIKGGPDAFGVDEKGRNRVFDVYSFAINSISSHLLFGRKIFTNEEISEKIYKKFSEIYKRLTETKKLGECEIVYLSPLRCRGFISGEAEKTINAIEKLKREYPFLITDYNKHEDVFIPLNKKQAIATESGKIVKIGWRGTSRMDPKIVREAVNEIVEKFVKYGLNEARRELQKQLKRIESLENLEDYKIVGRLSKSLDKYEKRSFRLDLLRRAYEESGKKPGNFIEFFVTTSGIDFSEKPKGKIDINVYIEYLMERLKPLSPLLRLEYSSKDNKLTKYMQK
ncbi:MAG: hypothetical protein QW040_03420 [Candidatus Aenigmatarchaeota archaeon]